MRKVELASARPNASWDEQPAEPGSASKVIESREHPTILKTTLRLGPVCPTSSLSREGAFDAHSGHRPPYRRLRRLQGLVRRQVPFDRLQPGVIGASTASTVPSEAWCTASVRPSPKKAERHRHRSVSESHGRVISILRAKAAEPRIDQRWSGRGPSECRSYRHDVHRCACGVMQPPTSHQPP